mgnify:CR=1 FL=1
MNKTKLGSETAKGGFANEKAICRKFNSCTWTLKDINTAMNFFGSGDVKISPRGSLYIGKITMQRKGGTPDPIKLQFKVKSCQLFNLGE